MKWGFIAKLQSVEATPAEEMEFLATGNVEEIGLLQQELLEKNKEIEKKVGIIKAMKAFMYDRMLDHASAVAAALGMERAAAMAVVNSVYPDEKPVEDWRSYIAAIEMAKRDGRNPEPAQIAEFLEAKLGRYIR
jgi:hypothetical protein